MSVTAELSTLFAPVDALRAAGAILGWDRQLFMPPGGGEARGRAEARLLGLQKTILASDEFERALETTDPATARSAERIRKPIVRIPLALLQRKVEVSNRAYDVWRRAKPANDWTALAPHVEELFAIARESAEHLGYDEHPYDALLDLFEPGTTRREVTAMFDALGPGLRDLVREIASENEDAALDSGWSDDAEALLEVMRGVTAEIGLRPTDARLDLANNAFCSGTARGDARLTTRASDAFKGVVSSSLHEMGHALYGTNIAPEYDGTPRTYAHGLAAHESQSRLWENMVGRSRGFWTGFLPRFEARFPRLQGIGLDRFLGALNRVHPEPVRVGSDELTYNLHILIRYTLEVQLIEGKLEVRDLPEAWDALYEEHLGLRAKAPRDGVLQDVHWTRGSVGYFPTYSMGNIVSGALWDEITSEFDTDALFARGDFAPVLDWLTERVYRHGSGRTAREITGAGPHAYLDPAPWLGYARAKFAGSTRG